MHSYATAEQIATVYRDWSVAYVRKQAHKYQWRRVILDRRAHYLWADVDATYWATRQ